MTTHISGSPFFDAAGVGDKRHLLRIGGENRAAAGGRWFEVIDPVSETPIATVADGAREDALAAVDAADGAARGWAATPARDRAETLRRCYEIMTARSRELATLISRENGKALADSIAEVAYAAEFFRWYAEEAVRIVGEFALAPGGRNRIVVQHQPIGIAVLVTPWNLPAAMPARKIAPALAAGCTCILKPAAETPLTAFAIGEILTEAGLPSGVLNIMPTTQPDEVVGAMLADPRVRKLSFTGSTAVGKTLLRKAAEQVISCSMELGGNAPFVVFDDADLDAALDGAMVAKMRHGGEACTAANRFLVQRGIYERFVAGLAKRMGGLKVGKPLDPGTELGPLAKRQSVEKISALVADALTKGARQALAPAPLPSNVGFYCTPAVLCDVPPDAAILREEIFGPVAAVVPFDTTEDAVVMANDTPFGLVAYVYSGDLRFALAFADRLEAGMVGVNRGLVSDPAAPFGGAKQSGIGREGAHEGMLAFTETKYVAVEW
jgi:succinate-semialdehyde dehydrogenase/glutarate-semialdehyde dehydrogenase